ncbi:hypothetical protein E4U56_008039 [Claviceps arundinis]|uniref:HAT C-terminal dimerisation domain-containing protein n=1 Tax=Claviceps arundinis TaxID=1623583 RepID=A0A9P7SLY4_9HYPO|nr:hypothetical protein E4U56_008039 [Claviceps arundinis]
MSAECERTFSSAGAMVSPMRSRLESSTIAASQTLRSWYKAGLIEGSELSDGLFTGVVDELAGLMDKLTTED